MELGEQTLEVSKKTLDIGEQTLEVSKKTLDIGEQTLAVSKKTLDVGEQTLEASKNAVCIGEKNLEVGENICNKLDGFHNDTVKRFDTTDTKFGKISDKMDNIDNTLKELTKAILKLALK